MGSTGPPSLETVTGVLKTLFIFYVLIYAMANLVEYGARTCESNMNDPILVLDSTAKLHSVGNHSSIDDDDNRVGLGSLDIDQLCDLLVHYNLLALRTCVREQSLSGSQQLYFCTKQLAF